SPPAPTSKRESTRWSLSGRGRLPFGGPMNLLSMHNTLQIRTLPWEEPEALQVPDCPTRLERPAFLLAFPFCYSTRTANNPWMRALPPEKRAPDLRRAMVQFFELYRFLASEALVYLLPAPRACGLQDLVFTGNLGVVLDHHPAHDVVVLSNFTSEP